MKKNNSGFTLIEILVVVAIIGILVAFVTLNFNDARKKSRDQARKSDLQTLQLAIETYKAQNGVYPEAGCGADGGRWAGPGPYSEGWGVTCDEYIVGLVPTYIKALPEDPNQEDIDNRGFIYRTSADRKAYKLMVHQSVETLFVTSYNDEFTRCPRNCEWQTPPGIPRPTEYAVYSVGAEGW